MPLECVDGGPTNIRRVLLTATVHALPVPTGKERGKGDGGCLCRGLLLFASVVVPHRSSVTFGS